MTHSHHHEDEPLLDREPEKQVVGIAELLQEELLEGELLGGASGLDRSVRWCVPWDDNPHAPIEDTAVWLAWDMLGAPDGEAVLEDLASRGVHLVVATPGASGNEDRVRRAADRLDLPVLRTTRRVSFREVNELVARKALSNLLHVLEYRVKVHRTLGDIFARGQGLDALVQTISTWAEAHVCVLQPTGEIQSSAGMARELAELPGTVMELVREVAERAAHEGRPSQPAREEAGSLTVARVPVDGEENVVLVAPLAISDRTDGILVCLKPSLSEGDHELLRLRVLMEEGSSLVLSELLRMRTAQQAEERARNDFVQTLLHGRFSDEGELVARAAHYRFDLTSTYAVVIVESPAMRPIQSGSQRTRLAVDRALASVREKGSDHAFTMATLMGSMLVVVREFPGARAQIDVAPTEDAVVRGFTEEVHASILRFAPGDALTTYGNVFYGATGVARSYRQARTALALSQQAHRRGVNSYSELRVYVALRDSALGHSGQEFAEEFLRPLRTPEAREADLEDILRAYVSESGNMNATARRLFLHRNTLLYKLERASKLLGMNIRESEAQFSFWLAIHLDELSDVHRRLDAELDPPR